MQPQSETFDAIVVGSGISGGWAAKELTERGLRVLMLERGKNVEHIKDYGNALKGPWEYPHRGGRTRAMEDTYPVLRRDYPLNEKNLDWWVSEDESPYTEVRRFDWYRGYHVGGRSLLWGRQSYRLGDIDFEANARDGVAVDWPIRHADLAPWYDHVERHAGISGSREGLPQLPDGQFQPAMPLNCVEEIIAGRLASTFGGRRLIPGRVANLTQQLPGRGACQYRNACWLGCPFGAYFSTQSSTLPAARATGRLTLRTFAIVTDVVYDRDRRRATGVRVLDAVTNQTTEYRARVVFLCASALNSTWILMRSAADVWPGGLGSSSGELGHNLMDHHFRCGANGEFAGHEDRYVYGRRPTGYYIPRFRNLPGAETRQYLRGFGYQGSASRQGWERAVAELGVGAAFKDAMAEPGPWRVGGTAFGEMLPNHANRVWLDETRTDKWGLPVLAIDCATGENERLMRRDMMNDMAEMLEAAGVTDVRVFDNGYAPGMGIHEMGTARMGRDPKTSVLNATNQVWDCQNVFVTDGACMTSSACQNPSLTYMALTARAAAHAVDELKRGNL
jgi:choline dehydrogenase-like flavoprotein